MSDDTTPSSSDMSEPSMEDILASIRKIIADDDQQTRTDFDPSPDFEDTTASDPQETIPAAAPGIREDGPALSLVESGNETVDLDLSLDDVVDGSVPLETQDTDIAPLDLDITDLDASSDDDILDLVIPDAPDTEVSVEPMQAGEGAAASLSSDIAPSDIAAAAPNDDAIFDDLDLLLNDDMALDGLDAPEADVAPMRRASIPSPTPLAVPTDLDAADNDPLDDMDALFDGTDGFDAVSDVTADNPSDTDHLVIDPAADMLAADALALDDAQRDTDTAEVTDDDVLGDDALLDAMFGDATTDDDTLLSTQDATGDDTSAPDSDTSMSGDSDLDLVKSLMADLTDDSFLGDDDTALALDTADVDLHSPDESEADVMDEILNLTLEQETAQHDDALDAIDQILAVPDIVTAPDALAAQQGPLSSAKKSLADIAADAQADAAHYDAATQDESPSSAPHPSQGFAALATAGVAASVTAAVSAAVNEADDNDNDAGHAEIETLIMGGHDADEDMLHDDASQDDGANNAAHHDATHHDAVEALDTASPTPDTHPTESSEETAMPRAAAKKDTIIDEVTEIEAASAFASLNNVVEEKAIVAERGDRIGDLVQEALRPMLKDWLDANLKGIVERAVAKEVKRISSGK